MKTRGHLTNTRPMNTAEPKQISDGDQENEIRN